MVHAPLRTRQRSSGDVANQLRAENLATPMHNPVIDTPEHIGELTDEAMEIMCAPLSLCASPASRGSCFLCEAQQEVQAAGLHNPQEVCSLCVG